MFDPITAALIRTAPQLEGLDLEDLPRRLAAAFANIVSARIRLRTAGVADDVSEIDEALSELRRLAAAHEAYVALLPERENRAAAAFVAAAAHQACMLGGVVVGSRSHIGAAAVTPDVCATLLFLVAEANADAAEAAKRIVTDSENSSSVESALLSAIRNLAEGKLLAIARAEIPDVAGVEVDAGERALQALQHMLLRGVKNLALQLLRRMDVAPALGGVATAATIFSRVKELCVEPIEGVLDSGDPVFSLYPGPLHLANLLLSVERDLGPVLN